MTQLTDLTSYADAQRLFAPARLWDLFDGNREHLNIAHECVDRWAGDPARVAVRIAHADGRDETITFRALSTWSARFAHHLAARGIARGDRVAIMLEPSLPFYAALFGAMKAGAVAVPLFTLFGPDGVRLRVADCAPRLLLAGADKAAALGDLPGTGIVTPDDRFMQNLERWPDHYDPTTTADDMAMFQYTSGTTRELPAAIRHTHRAIVVVMRRGAVRHRRAARRPVLLPVLAGLGARAVARHAGAARAGRRNRHVLRPVRSRRVCWRRCRITRITNLSAAATHYRMMKNSGAAARHRFVMRKTVLYRRADRQRQPGLCRGDVRRSAVQHVRHDRDRRGPGQLSGRRGFPREARLAGQAGAGRARSKCRRPMVRPAHPANSARSRCGATAHGFRPRIAAGSMPTAISSMPAAPTTSSSPPAGP